MDPFHISVARIALGDLPALEVMDEVRITFPEPTSQTVAPDQSEKSLQSGFFF
ncbi:hypothetical protein RMSM_04091 [Rhodopirellula maiorica SM1]|uniref:Uncharacterized protein n=1 Tax=Rhodopirellula maiorica SM1 TaxID=1265738 RepID=M5RYH6_9BACT|nr:hypothetical protein RMSM_04091 [Rhodopirellula maiorica SM1]